MPRTARSGGGPRSGIARNVRRALLALASAVAMTVVSALPASAAPAWSVVPPVAGAQYGHLASVSCATTASCFAVGIADSPQKEGRLVERWDGAHWTAEMTPSPAGAQDSQFTSVHCLTARSCVAVGDYDTGVATKTLIERWNGARWSIDASPNPVAISVTELASVQCASTTLCFAVGSYFVSTTDSSAEQTLVERWNGTAWSIVASPNQADANDSGLTGVACTSTTSCFAVGHYDTDLVTRTLIERWNGTSWSLVASANPSGAAQSELSGIMCPTAASCFAVGSGNGTLVEHWNGTTWSLMTSPNPARSTGASLVSVSCPSATRCDAVSDFFAGTVQQRLLETWNGAHWSIVATPAPAGTIRSSLSGVACSTTANCFAVGEYRLGPSRRPLIERFS